MMSAQLEPNLAEHFLIELRKDSGFALALCKIFSSILFNRSKTNCKI